MTLTLGGAPLGEINRTTVGLAAGLLAATLLGAILDALPFFRAARKAGCHQRCWVLGMLMYSYALLAPALVTTLFSFTIGALDSMDLKSATETMIEFIHLLGSTGSWWGAALVAFFAIAIPVLKIVLLALGEYWRHSDDATRIMRARRCIGFVQAISKWACPDMVAYILLLFLIRSLDHPPTLDGLFKLDIGFACYTLFCLGSTISSLGVHRPELPAETKRTSSQPKASWPLRNFGRAGTMALLTLLVTAFAVLLVIGLVQPCMALRLDIQILIDNGLITEDSVPFLVDTLHLPDLARADVTIPRAIGMLVEEQSTGFDANGILSAVMLAVFVIGLTVLDMLALMVAATGLLVEAGSQTDEQRSRFTQMHPHAFAIARKLKKLAMLDVAILGVVIVVAAGTVYQEKGLILSLRWGLLFLALAEACHYASYSIVATMADHFAAASSVKKAAEANDDCEGGKGTNADEGITASVAPGGAEELTC